MASLFCTTKAIETGSRRQWYAALVGAGLAFATLEVAFVLVLTLAVVAWGERRGRLALERRELWQSAGVFFGTVLVVWPAAVFKLAFLKSYLFMAYLAVARRAAWGEVTFAETWTNRFVLSPVEWILIGTAVALRLAGPRFRIRTAEPFLVFGGLMILAVLRVNTVSMRYALPFLPGLHVFAGMVLAGSMLDRVRYETLRWAATVVAVVLLGWNMTRFVEQHPMRADGFTMAILRAVREQHLSSKRLLVPQDEMPTLRYYFPEAKIQGFVDLSAESPLEYDGVLLPGQTRFTGKGL